MNCDNMRELFTGLIYDEISGEDEKLAREHLSTCESCTEKYKRLLETSTALGRWTEEQPETNLVFVEEKVPLFDRILGKFDVIGFSPRQLVFGAVTSFVLIALFMGIMRTDAVYRNGAWYISFGNNSEREEQLEESVLLSEFKKLQQENLVLMNSLLLASEERLRNENISAANSLANEFANQRRQDLTLIGRSINEIAYRNEGRFVRTNQLLDELYRLSSYQTNSLTGSRNIEGK